MAHRNSYESSYVLASIAHSQLVWTYTRHGNKARHYAGTDDDSAFHTSLLTVAFQRPFPLPVPDSNNSRFMSIPSVNNEHYWHCLANTLASSPWTDSTRNGSETLCHPHVSTLCLPDITAYNCTWPNLPGLPPPYLHTASNLILEVGTAWERGYIMPKWISFQEERR